MGELVSARLRWVSPALTSWYAEVELRAQLASALAVQADRVESPAFGAEFRDALAIDSVTDPLAWAGRRLDLPDGGWAVTGIRFRGGDVVKPFVDVVATSVPPTGEGLALLAQIVPAAYADFAPLCLRVEAPDADGLLAGLMGDPRFGPGCAVDLYVVAGPVGALRAHAHTTAYDRVRLRSDDPEPMAARVRSMYAELAERQPDLALWASPEDVESLRESADEGLLFEVLVDGAPAGVVAAVREDAHGMRGFSLQEICLDAEHRGRRLAPGVMQRLADELPAAGGDVLWGTIHPDNTPSLRNALSIGREVVSGYVWVTPEGLPGMAASTTG
jgi:L-amino acid N-acyltransferase YncA